MTGEVVQPKKQFTIEEIQVFENFANQVGALRSDVTALLYDNNHERRPKSPEIGVALEIESEFVTFLSKCQTDVVLAREFLIRIKIARETVQTMTTRFEVAE